VLNGVKWHVTSFNTADYAFFQAKLTGGRHAGEHAMFLVDLPSPGVRVLRTPAYTHTISHHHYMRENVAERFFRELRVERIWEGTSEIQRMIIAGQMTRRGPAALA
jgi:alkylation response protein AidB-like acyl-CoA dehydrogenase